MDWEKLLREEDRVPMVHESHTALVISVGDRVYKVKKPVQMGFADFTTFAERSRVSFSEVELNSRLSPDVYLGAYVLVAPDGSEKERIVVMRRLPESMKLERLIEAGGNLTGAITSIAHMVAGLHSSPLSIPKDGVDTSPSRYWARWETNLTQMLELTLPDDVRGRVIAIWEKAKRYYLGRQALFEKRVNAGAIRDGHGDLRADSIYCLPDAPRIVDCLEFDDSLRTMDRLEDVAFLAVDLERLGRPDLSELFLETYKMLSGDRWPESLMHASMAHWACVRAKVAAIADSQRLGDDYATVRAWLDLADKHLSSASVVIVLVGGSPGTGKSSVSELLGARLGWVVESSDNVRHDVLGVPHGESVGETLATQGLDAYTPEEKMAVYEELLRRARDLARMGESVVLDATWSKAIWREQVFELADELHCGVVQLRCTSPRQLVHFRLSKRHGMSDVASDADDVVADDIESAFDPWEDADLIDTSSYEWTKDLTLEKMIAKAAWGPA